MNVRLLPRSEWDRLSVTGTPVIGSTLEPEDAVVIVVEDEGRIVATMEAFRVTHFDGLWIDPDYRGNAGLGRKLIKAGIDAAKSLGATDWAWATSGTDHMDDVLSRMGGRKMPVETYVVPLH